MNTLRVAFIQYIFFCEFSHLNTVNFSQKLVKCFQCMLQMCLRTFLKDWPAWLQTQANPSLLKMIDLINWLTYTILILKINLVWDIHKKKLLGVEYIFKNCLSHWSFISTYSTVTLFPSVFIYSHYILVKTYVFFLIQNHVFILTTILISSVIGIKIDLFSVAQQRGQRSKVSIR